MAVDRAQQVIGLIAQGRVAQAEELARRLVRGSPEDPAALEAMRSALVAKGELDQALHYSRLKAARLPSDAHEQHVLADNLAVCGHLVESERVLRALIQHEPRVEYYLTLVTVLDMARKYQELESVASQALRLHPDFVQFWIRLASSYINQGRIDEAVPIYHRLLRDHPQDLELAQEFASFLNYLTPVDPARTRAAAVAYGRLLELKDFQQPAVHVGTRDPKKRPLRVGFLSSDFRNHSVAFFLRPLLEHVDPALVRPFGYMTSPTIDTTTNRLTAALKRAGGDLRRVIGMTDTAIARTIIADRIDILIDLNGLTIGQRMDVMRLKPAPVQMNWCGYPGTTGLSTIDWRVVDSITDPPHADQWATERLFRLDPCFLCYSPPPPDEVPPVGPPPYQRHQGAITFGSFNVITKVNREVMTLWARLLNLLPTSRLLIKATALAEGAARESLLQRLKEAGVHERQLTLLTPPKGRAEHLVTYNEVDLALDTFPYNGTTTTCEAMLMGVPTVTLAPPSSPHASRVGASLLTAVGLIDLIATEPDQYVQTAYELATHPERLADIRRGLRDRLLQSPVCDGRAFADRFTRMLEVVYGESLAR